MFFFSFFFFKQKTAYDLVSGDWSSDVCSSDLVGDIVTMREEDSCNPAQVSNTAHQGLGKTRRINEPVAFRVLHKVAGPAVRLLRMKAAIEDARIEMHGEVSNRNAHIVLL